MKTLVILLGFVLGAMAILDREFYRVLRVPVSASSNDIRQAYLRLSKKYHPDRNPNSRQKFQKINVAYETLSNEGKKYLYDRLGPEKMNDPNIQQEKNMALLKGSDIEIKLILTLEDLYKGKKLVSTIFKKTVCPHCLGSGAQNSYDIVRCSECQGQGKKMKQVNVGGGYYNMITETCPRCNGQGKIIGRKCSTCTGNKIISGSEEFKVEIPAGSQNQETIRYINMGDEREEGAPGDVVVRIIQAPHSSFMRYGNQLHTSITINLFQALFGFTRTIKQLDGRDLTISRSQITQPQQIIVLEGEGMPIKGTSGKSNMIVKVQVQIPPYDPSQLIQLKTLLLNFPSSKP